MTRKTKKPGPERWAYFETTISVLGYQEDAEWVALALEMDLRGDGRTWEEALDDLRDLVFMQISFAHHKGQPEMIWKSAEGSYWQRYREAQRDALVRRLTEDHPQTAPVSHAGGLEIPAAYVIAAQKDQFSLADG